MDRVKTGVAGLDTMLSGGLLPARPYVVSGPTGGGKTILSAHFLLEGLHAQEPCLLVTLDEPPIEVKSNVAVFGWNMDRLKILDATPDVRAHKRTRSVIDVGTSLDVRDMEQVTDIRQSSQVRRGQPHPDSVVPPVSLGARGDHAHRVRAPRPDGPGDRVLPLAG